MTVFEKIKELLDEAKVSYEVIEHEPVHTSADAARVRGTDLSNGAKALVMHGDRSPLLVVIPADKKASFKKLKSHLGIKDLRMASPEEVEALTTLKVGSIPPVGKAINLPSYFDRSFSDKDMVVFNAGALTTSITLAARDLIVVENPQIFDIVE